MIKSKFKAGMAATLASVLLLAGCGEGAEKSDAPSANNSGASSIEQIVPPDFFEAASHMGDIDTCDYTASLSISDPDVNARISLAGTIGDNGFSTDLDMNFKTADETISISTALILDGDNLYINAKDLIASLETYMGDDLGLDLGSDWAYISLEDAGSMATTALPGYESDIPDIDADKAMKELEGLCDVCIGYAKKLIKNMKTSPLSNSGDWAVLTIDNASRTDLLVSFQELTKNGDTDSLIDAIMSLAGEYGMDDIGEYRSEWAETKKDILDADIAAQDTSDLPDVSLVMRAKFDSDSFGFALDLGVDDSRISLEFNKKASNGELPIPKDAVDLEAWIAENMDFSAYPGGLDYPGEDWSDRKPWEDDLDDGWTTIYPQLYGGGYFELEGVRYNAGDTLEKFLANGWEWTDAAIEQGLDKTVIDPMSRMYGIGRMISKGDATIVVNVINLTDEALTLPECPIYGITINTSGDGPVSAIEGLYFRSSSRDEIIKVMTSRGLELTQDDEYSVKFEDSEGNSYRFQMYKSTVFDTPEISTGMDISFKVSY